MTDRSDRPLSSEEMLEQFRKQVSNQQPLASAEPVEPPTDPIAPPPRSMEPRLDRPPPVRRRPAAPKDPIRQADSETGQRAALLVAIAIGLVIFGFVAAIISAQGGI